MNVLVIGGCGFLGRNIVECLIRKGHRVGVYDRQKCSMEGVKIYLGDVLCDDNFSNILLGYDCIIYLVSAIMPKQSMEMPEISYTTDLPLLVHTLECSKKAGIRRIVFASSGGTVYGDSPEMHTESSQEFPICHYGICKLTCEKMLLLYNSLFQMENVILRISNPYGKYQKVQSGVGVITTLTLKVIEEGEIIIWGDGENVRDFVNVEDVANAFELACRWRLDVRCVPVFNIASGKSFSINEIVGLISDELNQKIAVNYREARPFDVRYSCLDIAKAKKYLGYVPQKAGAADIRRFIEELRHSIA